MKGLTTRRERHEAITGYLFIAPGMLLFLVFVFIPVIAAFYLSFTRYDIIHTPVWIGLDNYIRLFKDENFSKSIINTGVYAAGLIPIGMAAALGLAMILNEKIRGISFFRVAFYIPVVTSMVAISMIWMWMYHPAYGLINTTLGASAAALAKIGGAIGWKWLAELSFTNQGWLADPNQALWCVIIMSIWGGLGWNMVIYLAGLQGVPDYLYEAAIIDGASRWQRFCQITWPLLKPTTFFIFVTSVIGASQVFGYVYVMTNGGPNNATTTIVHQIFQNAFSFLKMGYASAMAFVLFVIIFAISMFNWRFLRSDVEYF
jgi:ABC-type sugar transport system permease subunit